MRTFAQPSILPDTSCPVCHSSDTAPRYIARRVGGALGAMAGAATGAISGGLGSAFASEADNSNGWQVVQTVAGALIGALVSGTSGCHIGASLGQALDDTVLHRWSCHTCGFSFGIQGGGRSRQGHPDPQHDRWSGMDDEPSVSADM